MLIELYSHSPVNPVNRCGWILLWYATLVHATYTWVILIEVITVAVFKSIFYCKYTYIHQYLKIYLRQSYFTLIRGLYTIFFTILI